MKTPAVSLCVSVAAAALCAAPGSASAQPGAAPGYQPMPAALPAEPVDEKSPGAALAWSLVSTAAGYAALYAVSENDNAPLAFVGLAGVLVGPSAGDIYAGDGSRALVHTGIRGGALLLTIAGVVQSLDDCFLEEDPCSSDGEVMMIGGMALFVGSSIYSIATASRTAREQNEKARNMMIAPTPIASGGGEYGLGLSLSGQL